MTTPGKQQHRTRAYRHGVLIAEGFPVDEVLMHRNSSPETVVWVDLSNPKPGHLTELAEQLGLHELAVEDALGEHQRPKLDEYHGHEFLVLRPVTLDVDTGKLAETEVDVFAGEQVMLTVRQGDRFPIEPVMERWDRLSHLAKYGVDYLLYGLIDHVVDEYIEVASVFEGIYDKMGEGLFDEKPLDPVEQEHWFQIRKSLLRFDQLVKSTDAATAALIDVERVREIDGLHPYYEDVRDHVIHVGESTDVLRVIGATIVDTNLAFRDYQQNRAMKKVTGWAGIIAVPTLITGYYGMNVPYPGESQQSGVVASSLLAVGAPVALYFYFKKRDWL